MEWNLQGTRNRGRPKNTWRRSIQKDLGEQQACVSRKPRKPLGPETFSGHFSGTFFGFREVFLNAPERTPDSPDFRVGRVLVLECFGFSPMLSYLATGPTAVATSSQFIY